MTLKIGINGFGRIGRNFYRALVAQSKGIVNAEVRLAEQPSAKVMEDIKAALREAAKSEIDLAVKIDPSLIGGLVVKIGSRMVITRGTRFIRPVFISVVLALTLKLLYAEAFRAPKPWDLTYGAGNPGLGPEEMRSMDRHCIEKLGIAEEILMENAALAADSLARRAAATNRK